METRLLKFDEERRLVFGWANVSVRKNGEQIVDHHGDMIDIHDLEEGAYHFVLEYRETGEMHQGAAVGRMVESCVFTKEKMAAWGVPEGLLPEGWWVAFYIEDDEAWAKVKKGDYKMFSVQGWATPEEMEGS